MFNYDWLVVLIDMNSQQVTEIVNDPEQMQQFYEEHKNDIWVGFNSRHYDQYILKAILCGFNPKEVNDFIIVQDEPGWKFSSLFRKIPLNNYDVMFEKDPGLKVFEGFMGNNIKESSVPFDIDRKLTPEEIKETLKYCTHDVEQTIEVFLRRIDEFNIMMYFINHFGFPLSYISKTKSQLAAIILGGNSKGQSFEDEFNFPFIPGLEIKKYKALMDWYRKPENQNYSKSQQVMLAGAPHVLSWGGIHGAIKKYTEHGIFLLIDVTAYYPSTQEKHEFGKRVINNWENFLFIHGSNIEFKRKGDKKARLPFKIMDNAISGQMKQRSSTLYDPMSNNSITVNGQMALVDLIEHLEGTCKLVQSNTDGLLLKLTNIKDFDRVDDIVYAWEQRIGVQMEFDLIYGTVYQKDVNNYLLVDDEKGLLKSKGAYVKKLSELDYDLPIVNKALVDYMVKHTPVEKTINECNDLKEFQQVKHIGRKYEYLSHGGTILNERTVRVFASKDATDGWLKMKHKKKENLDKVASTPEHCFLYNDNVEGVKVPDKLDKQWYVSMAKKRLSDFGVV